MKRLLTATFTILLALFLSGYETALAQTTIDATYTFGANGNVTSFAYNGTTNAGITVGDILKVGVTTSSSSGNFRASAWPTGATTGSDSFTGSVDLDKYIGFTVTPNSGFTVTVNSITFGVGRSATGTRQSQWRSSSDSFGSVLNNYTALNAGLTNDGGVLANPDVNSSWTGNTLTLDGGTFSNLSSAISFRYYLYNSEAAGGTAGLQGAITINLTISAVVTDDPLITLSSSSLANFTYTEGAGPSTSQSFNITASNFDDSNISVQAPSNYEVSLAESSGFADQISYLAEASKTVHVRLKSGLSGGSYSGNISISGGGVVEAVNVALSGEVTLPPPGISSTQTLYQQNFSTFVSAATIPNGWATSSSVYAGVWGTGSGAGLRGEESVLGYQHTGSSGVFTVTLTLQNNTDQTIESLYVSYLGKVARSTEGRSPEWTVSINDVTQNALTYSTVDGIDKTVDTIISDLSIAAGASFTIKWSSDRGLTTGASRQIGLTDVAVGVSSQSSTTITGAAGYRFLSSPVRTTIDKLLKQNSILTQCFTGADETGEVCGTNNVGANVYTWSTSTSAWVAATNVTNSVPAGSGVLVYVFDTGSTGGNMNRAMNVRGVRHALPVAPTMNASADGFTLIGNPSASTLSFNELTYANLYDVAYVWDPNFSGGELHGTAAGAGSWRAWNRVGGELSSGLIAPFQAFFVATNANGTPSLSIAEGAISGSAGSFRGKTTSEEGFALSLGLSGEGLRSTTWFTFSPGGDPGADNADAVKLRPMSSDYALLSSEGVNGVLLDINNLPLNFQVLNAPLHVETSASGSFTLNLGEFRLAEGVRATLSDLQTGAAMLIEADFSYEFTHDAVRGKQRADGVLPGGMPGVGNFTPEVAMAASDADARFVITFTNGETTSVDEVAEMPRQVRLEQNWPNPFNPSTQIRYAVPVSGQARLAVYDLLGREVAVLVDGAVQAGSHSVNFDASSLSSGMYVYRLTAGGQTVTQKMTLLK